MCYTYLEGYPTLSSPFLAVRFLNAGRLLLPTHVPQKRQSRYLRPALDDDDREPQLFWGRPCLYPNVLRVAPHHLGHLGWGQHFLGAIADFVKRHLLSLPNQR